jgi:hypothetical protein
VLVTPGCRSAMPPGRRSSRRHSPEPGRAGCR